MVINFKYSIDIFRKGQPAPLLHAAVVAQSMKDNMKSPAATAAPSTSNSQTDIEKSIQATLASIALPPQSTP